VPSQRTAAAAQIDAHADDGVDAEGKPLPNGFEDATAADDDDSDVSQARREAQREARRHVPDGETRFGKVVPDDEERSGEFAGRPSWLLQSGYDALGPACRVHYRRFDGPNVSRDGPKEPCAGRYYLHGFYADVMIPDGACIWTRLDSTGLDLTRLSSTCLDSARLEST